MADDRVLVIDNEESTCQLIKTVLGTRGFYVSIAQMGRVGLDLQAEKKFPLIFLDVDIRDLETNYMVSELKRLDDSSSIVLMGYNDHTTLIQDALNLGAGDYLNKPLKIEEIYFKTRHLIDVRKFTVHNARVLQGIEERNISLQKQNILLAKRIDESTKNLTKLYEDLRENYMRTIKALAHAIDARDHYTFSHSDNVTRYSEIIAREMKIDPAHIDDLKDACQLHDLGKIGVHDNILGKPSALTQTEFEEIKLHTEKGAQILEPLKFLINVTDIVKHHHERWDGGGYPDGLKGEAIPLGSRIMTVADSYDAMVSARPYRKTGLSKIEAIDEIKKHNGSQFDPKIVEAFLKVVNQF